MAFSPGSIDCKPAQEGSVVLDIEHDRILKLNGVGKEIWGLLSEGCNSEEIVLALSQKYGVNTERVSNDVSVFMERVAALGITPTTIGVSPRNANQDSHEHHPWYGQLHETQQTGGRKAYEFLAFLGLFLFDLILILSSLKTLCAWVKAWPTRSRSFAESTIGEICAAVQNACVWYPRKALCLQRSAVTTILLRSQGVPAQMIIGVREMPFLAHAWVEVNGSVVNDWPKVQSFYQSAAAH